MNVDIFECINFGTFPKIGNFTQIYFCIFDIATSMWHYKSYFHNVYIFHEYLINAKARKICTARKYLRSQYFTKRIPITLRYYDLQ